MAVQLTLVEPSGNDAPEAGVQATVTGVRPPDTVGAGYATCAVVVVVTAETLLGQLMVGAGRRRRRRHWGSTGRSACRILRTRR